MCLAAFVSLLSAFGCSDSGTPRGVETSATQPNTEAETPATQPNIVFILTDDLDFASVQQMPELNSLMQEEGISFENTFASYPLCCPSRATIFTGLYAHNHGVTSNKFPDGGFDKFRSEGLEEDTIAVRLREGGYRIAFFGKYLNEYPGDAEPTYVPPGWDEWYGKLDDFKYYDYGINQNGEVVSYGNDTEDYFTDVLSGQATDFVERVASDSEPFFMYVAPIAPHRPANPAERHQDAFAEDEAPRTPSFDEEDVSDKPSQVSEASRLANREISTINKLYQKRQESMLAVDEMVASLIQELEAAGELENTYIFFTSDNGWEQGEHRIPSGKNRSYEESARVPLFVRGPGVPAGSKTERLALNTDFASTFAELAGMEFPADGRSLVPLLRGKEPPWRSSILLEKPSNAENAEEEEDGIKGEDKNKAATGPPSHFEAVRTETHKYVEYGNGEKELYDLEADPYELDNVYEGADTSLVEDLKMRLDALRNCREAECREAENAS